MFNYLTKFSLKNPVAIMIMAIMLAAVGLYSFTTLKTEMFPSVEMPALSIQSIYPGASAQDVDEKVTLPLIDSLHTIPGIDKVDSQSRENISLITLVFPVNTNMDDMTSKLSSMFQQARLPDQVEPTITRFSVGTMPIMMLALYSSDNKPIEDIVKKDLQGELEHVSGVASVATRGTEEDFIEIVVNKDLARAYGLSLQQISDRVMSNYLSFPAGSITEDSIVIPLKVEQKITALAQLERIKFDVMQGLPTVPTTVSLGDIAQFRSNSERKETIRYNLQQSLSLSIMKKQDANTLEVSNEVIHILNKYKKDHGISFETAMDQSAYINQSVKSLTNEGLFGALFASIIVLLFLRNIRATFIAVLSIPLSLLIAMIFLARSGITLNMMTLGGMAVAVGRVVDDSIVIIENSYRKMNTTKERLKKFDITYQATKEMMKAILASTVTTIVVFLPLGLVQGVTGQVFLPFALTVVYSLIASFFVAITIVPVLAQFSFKRIRHAESKVSLLQRMYKPILTFCLNYKWLVSLLSIVILVSSIFLATKLGFAFLPNEQQPMLQASVKLPASSNLATTNDISLQIEKLLQEKKDQISGVYATVGGMDYRTGAQLENQVQYMINLTKGTSPEKMTELLKGELNDLMTKQALSASVTVSEMASAGMPSNNSVAIKLYSTDMSQLELTSKLIETKLQAVEQLKNIKSSFQDKSSQWILSIDALKANEAGVSGLMVLGMVVDQSKPLQLGSMKLDGTDQNVILTYDKPIETKAELENITVFGNTGPIKLGDIATVSKDDTFSAIERLDGKLYTTVTAEVKGNDVQAVTEKVQLVMDDLTLATGLTVEIGGATEETKQAFMDMAVAMLAAIGLVYVVMLITFGKARIPIVILTSLLFVPIGAIAGLFITGQPLSISAMIGLLMLIGIVVTNAIILVDRISQNRSHRMKIREAIIEAGITRIRPILMTALATVLALVPLALTESEGSLVSKGLAVVVIGGLVTSTILTLIVVPVVYEMFFFGQRKRERKNDRDENELIGKNLT